MKKGGRDESNKLSRAEETSGTVFFSSGRTISAMKKEERKKERGGKKNVDFYVTINWHARW